MQQLKEMFLERYRGMPLALAFCHFVKGGQVNIPDTTHDRFKSGIDALVEMAKAECKIESLDELGDKSVAAASSRPSSVTLEDVATVTRQIVDEKLGKIEALLSGQKTATPVVGVKKTEKEQNPIPVPSSKDTKSKRKSSDKLNLFEK